ncbi:probable LRR receptor-like serine/threonine-protein kinase, partial [Tanacetum coccineum]
MMEKRSSADDDPSMVHNKTKAVKSITTQDDNGDVPNNSETIPKSLTKANLRKLEANVPNVVDYDIWLPLASFHEVNDQMKNSFYRYFISKRRSVASVEGVEYVLRNGPWMIHGIPIFLNKWSPSVSIFKEELSHVPVYVKFHDVSLVTYTSDGLILMAMKIGTPMMLDSYTNSMCLESRGRSSYVRILIEINTCNEFSDHLVMAVLNLKGSVYMKETIRIEYEWKPPRCSTCWIFGHSLVDCPNVFPKRVVDHKDKDWVGYGLKSLLEQWRENNVDDNYEPYDDDMYEGQEIPNNIQTKCDNLDLKSGDDNSEKSDIIGSSSELNLSFNDTLYLHPNDTRKVFVSIDCGASGSFTDENTIVWKGDSDLISNGVTHAVQLNYTVSRVMDTMRAFTTRKKNCYSIEATQGEKVLVRAGFNYENYDRKSNPPNFDLHFDGNFWISVNSSEVKVYEAIYVVKKKVTSALFTNLRTAYAVNESIRFPKDPYDRIWVPVLLGDGLINVTNNATLINVDIPDNPPPAVLENGISVPNRTDFINLGLTIIDYPARYPIYINWYFSEVIKLNPGEIRSFRIYMDNVAFSLLIVPHFGNVTEYFITNLTATLDTNFSLIPIGDSTYPPLINAAELFSISDPLTDGTNNDDVEGLSSLQLAFRGLQEWGGDPCLPAPYSWEWIVCNNDPAPRVTSLVLNSINLSGPLPDFSNMNALEIIDMHNNSLTGPIPSFLGTLPNLKQFVAGNPLLCTNDKSCPGSGVLVIRHRRKTSVPPNSGNTSHRANVTSSGARGIKQFDVSDEDRFYSSPAPLLVG